MAIFRKKWNGAIEETAGRRIELYNMRRLHATLLLQAGIPEYIVDLLQGRPGSTILRQNYVIYTLYEHWPKYLRALMKPLTAIIS